MKDYNFLIYNLVCFSGLSKDEAQKYCDGTDIIVACHNAHDSVTISGPKEQVSLVQKKLDEDGVFCRSVRSEGVAFHHPTLKAAAPRLLSELQKVRFNSYFIKM